MNEELKNKLIDQFSKRIKSFFWRVGMMFVALIVQFVMDNLTQFHLSPATTIVVGLLLGEISKFLNQQKQ